VHGIESPSERLLKKKQPCGIIRVTVETTSSSVRISVVDDGGGIDFEKTTQAAERIFGVKSSSEEFNLAEAQKLIFLPGFSTIETPTRIAGRGVGLDAVKSAIESIGGTIQVSSKIGTGTTFEILFPRI
jgi:two-component system chemotaxis sensor kinase CheA